MIQKLKNSLKLQHRAKQLIPGLCQLLSKRPDQFSWGVWPGYYSKAKGVKVWDLDGNEYTDMSIGGIGATVLGYADSDIDNAVKRSIDNGVASSLNCPEEVELAELLCKIHPWAQMCRFTRTGGESMALAVRIARAYTGRDTIAFCGYHGWHDWYLAANIGTENALGEHLLPGLNPKGVPNNLKNTAIPFKYNDINELQEIAKVHKMDLGVIVLETIRNFPPEDNFLEKVREVADKAGAVLIVDEISSGFRLNSAGAHMTYNLIPDIAVFSKSIGNGYAISAIIGKSDIMSAAQDSFISSTNWTERVGYTAAIATIKKHHKENAGKHLIAIGSKVQEGWRILAEKHNLIINIEGIKPLSHFNFEYKDQLGLKALFIQEMLKRGFLASTIFYSMLAHSNTDVEKYLAATDEVFAIIHKVLSRNINIDSLLEGERSVSGFKRLT